MASVPPPSPEAQLSFLAKLQRLFAEGDFTATYKFALLIALADLAVELGADDGSALRLATRQIGERFIQQYWRQSLDYGTGRAGALPGVLAQNLGDQAAVVTAIKAFRARTGINMPWQAARHPDYRALLSKVTQTVSAQPLKFLQNFGGGNDPFLYERTGPGQLVLNPGVAYCLRRFHPLVQQLARTHWVGHVKSNKLNRGILGEADDLEDFLFRISRQSLVAFCAGLRKIDGDNCFYCGGALREVDVDHYIPFSLYPRDMAHNFVLAHRACNRSKSDMLAARRHLERWLERTVKRGDDLAEVGSGAGIVGDGPTILRVAAWGYESVRKSGGRAWVSPLRFEDVGVECTSLFDG
ncbi:HNH endonuclease [Variovorax ginsengisoli]|uniref:HNH endonuclease domain-containing protein n=1 Tax=Variovorax ginsengisoli TaxID=363844 RepID=A0ABT8SC01_9BURK|nr:HNH endonuclease domain-containing protein [Variovorax ginsengisoli]MDN8617274.1 HNH endonuclease domain-containing protein [Variovorax ginsengisoli]MDO1536444.1 HNH endonuclease domain-containing protein [Variovorax ginsengisoli]